MFLPRSVVGNLRDGVVMELDRLRARQLPFFCLQNRQGTFQPKCWQTCDLLRTVGMNPFALSHNCHPYRTTAGVQDSRLAGKFRWM